MSAVVSNETGAAAVPGRDAKQPVRRTTCRMFETPLIERFSRVHPAAPFVFYLPILAWVGYVTFSLGATVLPFVALLLAGALLWTLTEYVLHRWVFHYVGPRPWQRRLHFVIHGVHHDFPQDATRLVMPLGASIPMGVAFYALFRLALGPVLGHPLFIGFALGYLAYDGLHFAVHHFRMSSRAGKWLKRYHMIHHHTGVDARYGVSSPLWDYVFGTAGGETTKA
jgi:sterol desaturase/sphingolipid hydroxylase (fatty acid hydroxylase superfamily)